jgi:hypothetical protein
MRISIRNKKGEVPQESVACSPGSKLNEWFIVPPPQSKIKPHLAYPYAEWGLFMFCGRNYPVLIAPDILVLETNGRSHEKSITRVAQLVDLQ